MFRVPKHIWRTVDGRLVPDGHVDAAFLAYTTGQDLTDDDAKKSGADKVYTPAEQKMAEKQADKAVKPPANKSGSGVTITRSPGPGM